MGFPGKQGRPEARKRRRQDHPKEPIGGEARAGLGASAGNVNGKARGTG